MKYYKKKSPFLKIEFILDHSEKKKTNVMTHKIISTISNHEPRRDASIYDQTFLFLFKPTFFSFTAKKVHHDLNTFEIRSD